MTRALLLLLPLGLAACVGPRQPAPQPRYLLGDAYAAGGVWYYPAASYSAEETGLAAILPDDHPPLTANGEAFDATALAAAHQTLQLPAIARLTNLDNGRSVAVRLNDRGPASPTRLVAVTPRAAELLGFPASGIAPVRLTVLDGPSRSVAAALRGEAADRLTITTAPRGEVQQADLAPPQGGVAAAGRLVPDRAAPAGDSPAPVLETVPDRLPETVTQYPPEPGALVVRMGVFSRRSFAEQQRARTAALGATIERSRVGRSETYRVRIGPLAGVAEADRVLEQVIRDGVPDARIVVE